MCGTTGGGERWNPWRCETLTVCLFDTRSVSGIFANMKLIALAAALLVVGMASSQAKSLYDIPLKDIHGKDTSLAAFKGKAVLIVNVASKCGNTPQYAGLEAAYKKYKDQGLVVLGFPCNDFGGQEPGTSLQIVEFCKSTYDVSFPLFEKLKVLGEDKHPLYVALTGEDSPFPGDVKWNFGKFLIGKNGEIVNRFSPRTQPDSEEVTNAIETALK